MTRRSRNRYLGEDPTVVALVRRLSCSTAHASPYSPADIEDIEQELFLEPEMSRNHFDPKRATWRTFAGHVSANRSRDLVTYARAAKRFPGTPLVSLDAPPGHDNGEDENVPDAPVDLLPDLAPGDPDQHIDVRRFLDGLPDGERDIAELVAAHGISGAARLLRVPRSTVRRHLRDLRARAIEAGLRESCK
jgi:DNA-directed RNA polymerase specialized sigma24 family protein